MQSLMSSFGGRKELEVSEYLKKPMRRTKYSASATG